MRIVPAGTKRYMIAQAVQEQGNMGAFGEQEQAAETGEMKPALEAPAPVVEQPTPLEEQVPTEEAPVEAQPSETEEMPAEGEESDLTEYITQVLQGFGYPPRRLEEFEKEFINEKIYSGGVKDVAIVLPDRYYGTRRRISDKDLSKLVNEIQKNFGLNFVDAERKDKKLNINFSSKQEQSEEDAENAVAGDILDEVYGPSDSGKKKQKPKKEAETLAEMIKTSKIDFFELLSKRLRGEE